MGAASSALEPAADPGLGPDFGPPPGLVDPGHEVYVAPEARVRQELATLSLEIFIAVMRDEMKRRLQQQFALQRDE